MVSIDDHPTDLDAVPQAADPAPKSLVTLGDWAHRAIDQHYRAAIACEAGTIADRDPEELHQLRVGLRRLRSAISGFAIALDWPDDASERRISQLGRPFGKLRDLDVMGQTLQRHRQGDLHGDLPKSERKALHRALKFLRDRRRKRYRQTAIALRSKPYRRFKRAIETWLDQPQYAPSAAYRADRAIPDLLLPETSRFLIHPAWTIAPAGSEARTGNSFGGLALDTWNCLHDLRKQAKRLRYQMALVDGFYDQTLTPQVQAIAHVQTVLGDLQDSAVLEAFLERTGLTPADDLPVLFARLQRDRAHHWQQWDQLRDRYRRTETCQTLRQTLAQSVAAAPRSAHETVDADPDAP